MDAPALALAMARSSTVFAAHSAEPDAPVVADRGPRAERTRAWAAALLTRVATAIEPRCEARGEARGGVSAGIGHAAT
ncbi:MAG: hypothetical protein AAGC49_09935 [Brevundimonas sp.]